MIKPVDVITVGDQWHTPDVTTNAELTAEAADTGAVPDITANEAAFDQPEAEAPRQTEVAVNTDDWRMSGTPADTVRDEPAAADRKETPTPQGSGVISQALGKTALPADHPQDTSTVEAPSTSGDQPTEPADITTTGEPTDTEPGKAKGPALADAGSGGNGPIDHGGETGEDGNGPRDAIPGRQRIIDTLEDLKTEDDPDGSSEFMDAMPEGLAPTLSERKEQIKAVASKANAAWLSDASGPMSRTEQVVGTCVVQEAAIAACIENGYAAGEVNQNAAVEPVTADQVANYVDRIYDHNNVVDGISAHQSSDSYAFNRALRNLHEDGIRYAESVRLLDKNPEDPMAQQLFWSSKRQFEATRTAADLEHLESTEGLEGDLPTLAAVERGFQAALVAHDWGDMRVEMWKDTVEGMWKDTCSAWRHERRVAEAMSKPPRDNALVIDYQSQVTSRLLSGNAERPFASLDALDRKELKIMHTSLALLLEERGCQYTMEPMSGESPPTLEELKEKATEVVSASLQQLRSAESSDPIQRGLLEQVLARIDGWGSEL